MKNYQKLMEKEVIGAIQYLQSSRIAMEDILYGEEEKAPRYSFHQIMKLWDEREMSRISVSDEDVISAMTESPEILVLLRGKYIDGRNNFVMMTEEAEVLYYRYTRDCKPSTRDSIIEVVEEFNKALEMTFQNMRRN